MAFDLGLPKDRFQESLWVLPHQDGIHLCDEAIREDRVHQLKACMKLRLTFSGSGIREARVGECEEELFVVIHLQEIKLFKYFNFPKTDSKD